MDEPTLVRDARRMAGCDAGDAGPFTTALRTLVSSLERDARLTFLGRVLLRRHLVRNLSNALTIDREVARDPGLAREPVQRPLFIVGFPRTGTTLLHRLLACVPGARAPRLWELMWPAPPPGADPAADDRRRRRAEGVVRGLGYLAPRLATIHAFDAHGPEECYHLLENTFMCASLQFYLHVPSYASWLARQDMTPAYARYRLQLQLLQRRLPASPWILKWPQHAMNLDAIFAMFPDAAVVHTHRRLTAVAASSCSYSAAARSMVSERVDPAAMGAEWFAGARSFLDRALAARDRIGPAAFFDLQYEELTADPIGCVRRICDRFGLTLTGDAEARMRAVLDGSTGGGGSHRYTLAQFGLDGNAIDRAFGDYHQRFGVG